VKDKASAAAVVAKATGMIGVLVNADAEGGYIRLSAFRSMSLRSET